MAELLIPADDEVAVVTELTDRLGGRIGTAIPNPRPAEFVRVVSAGGSPRDLVADEFRLAVEAFAKTESRARQLCALAVGHAQAAGRDGAMGGVACYGVRAVGLPANLPMPSVPDRYRYSAAITVTLRRIAG